MNMESLIVKNERNYGIDLLRILAMYMVVVLHFLGHGGVLEACEKFSINYYVAWFLETSAYCAVDVFAMISGFVMVDTKFKLFRIVPLWITVIFYSSLLTILFRFVPSLSALCRVSNKELIKGVFFPVVSQQYWYFTSYFGMFFFIPFINKMICLLNKKEYTIFCITIIVLFSLLPIFCLNRIDSFNMRAGYSTSWLMCMYIIGAYFKKFPIKFSKKKCFIFYILAIFFAWFSKFMSHILIKLIFNLDKELDLFIDYTSIFIVISGIALLLLFSQISIKSELAKKSISFISGLAFSVYIIHEQQFVRDCIIKNRFVNIAFESPIFIIYKTFCFSFLIFICCWLIDLLRFFLFKLLKLFKNIFSSFSLMDFLS